MNAYQNKKNLQKQIFSCIFIKKFLDIIIIFDDFSWLSMTLAIFHDFPGLENGLTKFHDFPGRVVTL